MILKFIRSNLKFGFRELVELVAETVLLLCILEAPDVIATCPSTSISRIKECSHEGFLEVPSCETLITDCGYQMEVNPNTTFSRLCECAGDILFKRGSETVKTPIELYMVFCVGCMSVLSYFTDHKNVVLKVSINIIMFGLSTYFSYYTTNIEYINLFERITTVGWVFFGIMIIPGLIWLSKVLYVFLHNLVAQSNLKYPGVVETYVSYIKVEGSQEDVNRAINLENTYKNTASRRVSSAISKLTSAVSSKNTLELSSDKDPQVAFTDEHSSMSS